MGPPSLVAPKTKSFRSTHRTRAILGPHTPSHRIYRAKSFSAICGSREEVLESTSTVPPSICCTNERSDHCQVFVSRARCAAAAAGQDDSFGERNHLARRLEGLRRGHHAAQLVGRSFNCRSVSDRRTAARAPSTGASSLDDQRLTAGGRAARQRPAGAAPQRRPSRRRPNGPAHSMRSGAPPVTARSVTWPLAVKTAEGRLRYLAQSRSFGMCIHHHRILPCCGCGPKRRRHVSCVVRVWWY